MPWLAIPSGDPRKETSLGCSTWRASRRSCSSTPRPARRSTPTAAVRSAPTLRVPITVGAEPVNDLSSPDGINDTTALCALVDGYDADAKAAAKAVLAIAEASKAAGTGLLFFVATSGDGAVPQVRKLTGVGAATATAQMILLGIPDDGGFYVAPTGRSRPRGHVVPRQVQGGRPRAQAARLASGIVNSGDGWLAGVMRGKFSTLPIASGVRSLSQPRARPDVEGSRSVTPSPSAGARAPRSRPPPRWR